MRASILAAIRLVSLASLAFATSAHAEPAAADRALATDLFDQARALVADGKYSEACPKFAESQRLDPGPGTLLNVANCHEHEGKTATAWSEFSEALSVAERERQPDRVAFAQMHIEALARRLSRLVIRIPPSLASRELEISRDGSTIATVALGRPMPIDPGRHRVDVRGPGIKPWSTEVDIADGAQQEVEVGPLETEALTPVPVLGESDPAAAPSPLRRGPSAGRIAAFGAGGLGIVAMGVGTVAGIVAISTNAKSESLCAPRCSVEGFDLHRSAATAADISTIGFVVGAVALGASVLLYVMGRPPAAGTSGLRATGDASMLRF